MNRVGLLLFRIIIMISASVVPNAHPADAGVFSADSICGDRRRVDTDVLKIDYSAKVFELGIPLFIAVKIGSERLQVLRESTQLLNQILIARAEAHNSCSANRDEFSLSIDRAEALRRTVEILVEILRSASQDDVRAQQRFMDEFDRFYGTLLWLMYPHMPNPSFSRENLEFDRGKLADELTISNQGDVNLSCQASFPKAYMAVRADGQAVSTFISPGAEAKIVVLLADLRELPDGPNVQQEATFLCNSRLMPRKAVQIIVSKPGISRYLVSAGRTTSDSEIKARLLENVTPESARRSLENALPPAVARLAWGSLTAAVNESDKAVLAFEGLETANPAQFVAVENVESPMAAWSTLWQSKVGLSASIAPTIALKNTLHLLQVNKGDGPLAWDPALGFHRASSPPTRPLLIH